jgi:peptide/nickel transport system ATP-binding protein
MRNEELADAPVDPLSNIKPSTLISVKDLTVEYSLKKNLFGKPVQTLKGVDGISFDIMEGETLGLVGESGCGKTTLGRALLRLIDHSSGSISYRGRSLDKLSDHKMRALRPKLQIIFQDPYSSLNPRITIGDAIAEPLAVHSSLSRYSRNSRDSRRDTVIELMEQVGLLPDWYSRYPHELSGGQRQRGGIARALAAEPLVLLADEPVSALDVAVQAQLLRTLARLLRGTGLAMLFVSHDLAVVRCLCPRAVVMDRGRVVESGPTAELFSNPRSPFTRELLGAVPRLRRGGAAC